MCVVFSARQAARGCQAFSFVSVVRILTSTSIKAFSAGNFLRQKLLTNMLPQECQVFFSNPLFQNEKTIVVNISLVQAVKETNLIRPKRP